MTHKLRCVILLALAIAMPACKTSSNVHGGYTSHGFSPEELTRMMESSAKDDQAKAAAAAAAKQPAKPGQASSKACSPKLLYCKCGCVEGRTGIPCRCP